MWNILSIKIQYKSVLLFWSCGLLEVETNARVRKSRYRDFRNDKYYCARYVKSDIHCNIQIRYIIDKNRKYCNIIENSQERQSLCPFLLLPVICYCACRAVFIALYLLFPLAARERAVVKRSLSRSNAILDSKICKCIRRATTFETETI